MKVQKCKQKVEVFLQIKGKWSKPQRAKPQIVKDCKIVVKQFSFVSKKNGGQEKVMDRE